MNTTRYITAAIALVLSAAALKAEKGILLKVSVNPEQKYQKIEYFGAADAWSGNFVGQYWNGTRDQVAKWLFSTKNDAQGNPEGIGLSMWRVNTGAGTYEQDGADIQPIQRRAESFKTKDGSSYDWSKCAGQQYFMKAAKSYGCNSFILFSNSPLVQYTLNGKGWTEKNSANIKPEGYKLYAKYLADVAAHFLGQGYGIKAISPINEPQVNWGGARQEGSAWTNVEVKKMAVALNSALEANKKLKKVGILMGETAALNEAYASNEKKQEKYNNDYPDRQIYRMFNPSSPSYIGNLKHVGREYAAHAYHCNLTSAQMIETRTKAAAEAAKYGINLHQSEWCLLPNYVPPMLDGFTIDWSCSNRGDLQVGLLMGRMIYADFTIGQAKSWSYWKGMELEGNHALVGLKAVDGDILKGGSAFTNKILWALGNYSRFIRPGYSRIDVGGTPDLNGTVASGYLSPDKKTIIVVFVNSSFNTTGAEMKLPEKWSKKIKSAETYTTDETMDLKKDADVDLSDVSIPARSLVTLKINL